MQFLLQFLSPNMVLVFFLATFIFLALAAVAKNKKKLQLAFTSFSSILLIIALIANFQTSTDNGINFEFVTVDQATNATTAGYSLVEKIVALVFSLF